jgi:hypothetical protein
MNPLARTKGEKSAEASSEGKAGWDAFICHASEDKADVADPLYEALTKRGLKVWYDRAEIRIGDSLRRKIDEGLAKSRFGIVILSEHFFAKDWPPAELDGLVSREVDGRKVILPIWHGLSVREVRERSPLLAGRLAARTEEGIDAIVDTLLTEITGQVSEPSPSLREAAPGIGAAGIGSSRALRSALRGLKQREVNRVFDELVDQLTSRLDQLPVDSRDNADLLKVADDLEPLMATLLSSLCEVAESDRASLPKHVRAIYAISNERVPRSGITTWLEIPTWVMWWLQTALSGYLAWREDWDGIGLLAKHGWVDGSGEYQPSTSLTPKTAGQGIATVRRGNDDLRRYGDFLPVIDLVRTLREVGYFKAEHPQFIGSDNMPFRPIAIGLLLTSLRGIQLRLPLKQWAWRQTTGYVEGFARRIEADADLRERLAHELFGLDVEGFEAGYNDWVKAGLGGGWLMIGGSPWGGPMVDFARFRPRRPQTPQ